jgi:RNase H-like domain found in reverse transcriptase
MFLSIGKLHKNLHFDPLSKLSSQHRSLLSLTTPFCFITDASDFAMGVILEQPDALNRWHPIAYHSKSMQPAERNYKIHNKELLAIVRVLEIFHHYLEGRDDTVEIWSTSLRKRSSLVAKPSGPCICHGSGSRLSTSLGY